MNSDGSVCASGQAPCGGLLRDAMGRVLGGFVTNLGICPVTIAELWGIYYALHLAWENGFRHLILEVDSMSALQLVRGGVKRLHPYAMVIQRVHNLLSKSWNVCLIHIFIMCLVLLM